MCLSRHNTLFSLVLLASDAAFIVSLFEAQQARTSVSLTLADDMFLPSPIRNLGNCGFAGDIAQYCRAVP